MKRIPLTSLPQLPGIYLFKDANGVVLYIGKAKSLRRRVQSYFRPTDDWKVLALQDEVDSVEHILTTNETEALLLEAQLVRQHQPKYNRLLKAGHPFVYILVTKDEPPILKLVRSKTGKGLHIGPFLHKKEARRVYAFLMHTFRLKLCNKKITQGCLDYHLGNCPGSCMPNFDVNEYKLRVSLAIAALKNNQKEFVKTIQDAIKEHNAAREFEKSRRLYSYLKDLDTIFATLAIKYKETKFDDQAFLATEQSPFTGIDTTIVAQELAYVVGLSAPVRTIDCFDISHFQSKSIVGSCIRFKDGKPDKDKFRRFKIKTLTQQNDYAALQEILLRRYRDRSELPDLILIDGGIGQRNAAKYVLPDAPIVSLAKREEILYTDNAPQGIKLDIKTEVGRLLIALRDYAHHFAISYHRLRRRKQQTL